MDRQLITDLTTGIIAIGLIVLAGKKQRFVPPSRLSFEERMRFEHDYKKWSRFEGLIAIVAMIFFGISWFLFLQGLASLAFDRQGLGIIVLKPCVGFWALIAIFMGIISPMPWFETVTFLWLGDRYPVYYELSGGAMLRRMIRIMELIIYPLAVVAILVGFRTYTAFDEKSMIDQGPLSLRATYSYDQIARLAKIVPPKASGSNQDPLIYHAILFKDGTVWTTKNFVRDPDQEADPALLDFVSNRCGQPVVEVHSLEELKP